MDGWIEELIADDQERTKVLLKKRCCRHDSSTINCKNIHMGPCTKMKMIITARVATVQKLLAAPETYEFMGFPFWFSYYYYLPSIHTSEQCFIANWHY